jgi:hypothetical protein
MAHFARIKDGIVDAGTGEPPKRYQWDEATTSWVEQGA